MPFRHCKAAGILAGCFVLTAVLFAAISYFGSWAALRAYIGGHSAHVFPSAVDLGVCKAGTEVSVSFFVENLTSSERFLLFGDSDKWKGMRRCVP